MKANSFKMKSVFKRSTIPESPYLFQDNKILIFGVYNKKQGTLSPIERNDIMQKKVTLFEINMPCPLRRFTTVRFQ